MCSARTWEEDSRYQSNIYLYNLLIQCSGEADARAGDCDPRVLGYFDRLLVLDPLRASYWAARRDRYCARTGSNPVG